MTTAITADAFLSTTGVDTHIGMAGPYQNVSQIEQDVAYLGVATVRDSIVDAGAISAWQQVAQAGIKFDDFMPQGPYAWDQAALALVPQLVQDGLLSYVEGGNEEDDSYALSNGNSLQWAAQFQQQVYAMGQQQGIPVINMSFGQGWTAANNWQGHYGAVGDLSPYADYANAHTYPSVGQTPDFFLQFLNADALLSASQRPVITTEMGWQTDQFGATQIAQNMVDAAFDGIKNGDADVWFYGLYDDTSGNWGLFNPDGSARPSATAVHNLTTLLKDSGSNANAFSPGSLDYTLSGTQPNDNTLLIEKSDGTYWLALWNEVDSQHTVNLSLPSNASSIQVFDPVTDTAAVQNASDTSNISVSLGADPLLVEIVPPGTSATGSAASSGSSTTPEGGSASGGTPGSTTATGSGNGNDNGGSTSPTTTSTITIAADDPSPVEVVNSAAINATGGNHMLFIAGTGNVATLTDGTETVQSYTGGNTINTGAGDDLIRVAGNANVINAGDGNNTIEDSGSNNTIVLPGSGGNDNVFGWVMQNGDMFDLRSALASTSWDGTEGTLGNYVSVSAQDNNTIVTLQPNGPGSGSVIATVQDTGPVTLSGFLQHAIT